MKTEQLHHMMTLALECPKCGHTAQVYRRLYARVFWSKCYMCNLPFTHVEYNYEPKQPTSTVVASLKEFSHL